MATNLKSGSTSTIVANQQTEASDTGGGTAVMEMPAPGVAKDLGVSPAGLKALTQAAKDGVDLRSPKTPKAQRKAVQVGALEIMLAVGLGAKSDGFGPIVQRVIVLNIKQALGLKRVGTIDITADNVIKALSSKTVVKDLADNLTAYTAAMEPDVSEDTKKARAKNLILAKSWIDAGMFKAYILALKATIKLGGFVNVPVIHGMASLPLNRALGMAFGRGITASEGVRQMRKLAPI